MAAAQQIRARTLELIRKSGFPVTDAELAGLKLNDFGLGQLEVEGFEFIDFVLTPRIRMTLLVLLPNQTLPEYYHPAYGQEPGKEETIRCLWAQTRVYVPGVPNNARLLIPAGKGTIPWRPFLRNLRASGYTGSWDLKIACPATAVDAEYAIGRAFLQALKLD